MLHPQVLFEYSQAGVQNFHLNQEILVKIFFNRINCCLIPVFGCVSRRNVGLDNGIRAKNNLDIAWE